MLFSPKEPAVIYSSNPIYSQGKPVSGPTVKTGTSGPHASRVAMGGMSLRRYDMSGHWHKASVFLSTTLVRVPRLLTFLPKRHSPRRDSTLDLALLAKPTFCAFYWSQWRGEPFQYHALGVKPFRIPLTEKYAIEKVKPLHGTITLFGHH